MVIERDPLHRQIPLAHDLPEEPEEDTGLQFPLAAEALHLGQDANGSGADRHLYQGHVLVLVH